jgi:hypothetical protein
VGEVKVERFNIQNGSGAYSGPASAGGVQVFYSKAIILNSVIKNNYTEGYGGGVNSFRSELSLINTTVTANTAQYDAGGVNSDEILVIRNSTIAYNTALGEMSYQGGLSSQSVIKELTNSIIANNQANRDLNCISAQIASRNIVADSTGCYLPQDDYLQVDPKLPMQLVGVGVPAYYPLINTSPAVDAGDPAFCPTEDQRGASQRGRANEPRPADASIPRTALRERARRGGTSLALDRIGRER